MAIYPEIPAPFRCVICLRDRAPHCQPPRPYQDRPPVCWSCEDKFGTGPYGDANPDRRTIKQISALVCALEIEAHRNQLGEGPMYG